VVNYVAVKNNICSGLFNNKIQLAKYDLQDMILNEKTVSLKKPFMGIKVERSNKNKYSPLRLTFEQRK
jgi:hypothetical protein